MSKISELSDGGSLVSTDYLIAVRSGGNVKVRMDEINVDQVDLGDNEFIRLGNSQDLTLVHDASNSIINQAGIGDLLIQKAGTTKASFTTNGLEFPDNSKAIFGAGSDLEIYHDGSNSYIDEVGTGNLLINADNLRLRDTAGNPYLLGNTGAEVRLYYNGSTKVQTTATGAAVTGSVSADGLTVETATGSASPTPSKITIATSTSASDWSTTAPWGRLAFYSADASAGGAKEEVTLDVISAQAAGGVADFTINTYNSGAKERFRISYDGDISFYDSAGTSQSFFWDASAESLGIGTSSPSVAAHAVGKVRAQKTGQTNAYVQLSAEELTSNYAADIFLNDTGLTFKHNSDSRAFVFDQNGTERMRISSDGNVGIGTTSPNTRFQVSSDTTTKSVVETTGTTSDALIEFTKGQGSAETWSMGIDNSNQKAFSLAYLSNGSPSLTTHGVLTVDTSGNVGIGTNSPSGKLDVELGVDGIIAEFRGGDADIFQVKGASNTIALDTRNTTALTFEMQGAEAMRIDASRNLLVGTTNATPSTGGFSFLTGAVDYAFFSHDTGVASGNYYIGFRYASTNVGAITQSGTTGVSYNTSSDQRLKDNIVDAPSASDDIDAIQVRSFDWKADGSHQKYGMIAQELQTVAPEVVSVPEDPEEMMGVDYSKLVPMMLKEIQSLRARVAQLES